jgi:glycosyltransferase involved in cell wall biosynthesis
MKKDILVYAMMSWDDFEAGIDNTNAHILRWLEKRQDVKRIFFVDFRQYTFISKVKYFLKTTPFLKNSTTFLYRFFYRVDHVSDKLFRYAGFGGSFSEILQSLLINPEEVWSFNPLDVNFLENFKKSKKIFYNIDDWRENTTFRSQRTLLDKNYNLIKSAADYIFTPSSQLIDKLWSNSGKAFHINNAVDLDFFSSPEKTPAEVKNRFEVKLGGLKRPLIGYMGVITPDRVDYELVGYLAARNPDKTFVYAGPVWSGFKAEALSKKYPNVNFLGLVHYQEMPYLLSKFDVCLIPHLLNNFTMTMNPKKLYEYLASGKPVVATRVAGSEMFAQVIYLADSAHEFNEKIKKALDEDSDELRQARMVSIRPQTWEARFNKISTIIGLE